MHEMMQSPMFFYAVAFFIFAALIYKYVRKPVLGWLDSKILEIRNELDRARTLRIEAETMLKDYRTKQAAAMAEAEGIVKYAKEEAARLRTQAEADLKATLARHEQQAAERIRIAETEAVAEVRNAVIDRAMQLARETLNKKLELDDAAATKLIEQAIADVATQAAKKAKAA